MPATVPLKEEQLKEAYQLYEIGHKCGLSGHEVLETVYAPQASNLHLII